jgi:hypothetical protein
MDIIEGGGGGVWGWLWAATVAGEISRSANKVAVDLVIEYAVYLSEAAAGKLRCGERSAAQKSLPQALKRGSSHEL